MQVDLTYGLCCQCTESTEHVLWECPLARNVWVLCRGKIQKCPNAAHKFSLFKQMVDKLTQQELEYWATVSRAIWNARKKFCFEKIQRHLENILREATGFLQEYQRLNAAQVPGDEVFKKGVRVGVLTSFPRLWWCCFLALAISIWLYCNASVAHVAHGKACVVQ